jgi:iron complex outermembrane receptor protein
MMPRSSILLPVLAAVCSVAAYAQEAQVTVSIPTMPLSKALLTYAQQTHLSILAPDELTQGRQSVAVSGTLGQSEALRRLLGDSGLKFQFIDANSVRVYADREGGGGAAESEALETIIVTAQYRRENQQQVPISINSVSGKTIEDSGYQSITDLQYLVPGVQFDPTGGANFLIRGVGLTSYDFSFEKSVSVVVDDVVMDAQRDNGLIGLVDIDRIDVLMGPQGTLFGKNATSGVISVTTGAPTLNAWAAKAYASYGERDDHMVNALFNAPIGNEMALRITAFNSGQDGFGKYTTLDELLGTVREYGTRAKLLYQPTDSFDITLAGDWAHHFDNSIRTAVSGGPASLVALEKAYGVNPGPTNASTADSEAGSIRYDEWGTSLRAHYMLGEDTLTSISAARLTTFLNAAPVDLVPADIFGISTFSVGTLNSQKLSQELRWASPTGGFVEYVAGFYYNDLTANQYQYQLGPYPLETGLITPSGAPLTVLDDLVGVTNGVTNVSQGNAQYFQTKNITAAEFGQLKFNLTDEVSLVLGGRYSNDRNKQSLSYLYLPTQPITGTNLNYTYVAGSKPLAFNAGSTSGHDFTYRIAPQYKFSDNGMAYFTYATGNKPGGVAFNGGGGLYQPYSPETAASYELGEKSEWFNHRLRLNFDLFREQYDNYQAQLLHDIPVAPGVEAPVSAIGNAGGLRSQGAETSIAFKPIQPLELSANLAYDDAYFTNYVANATTNYTGTRPPNAPAWSGMLGADYTASVLPDLGMLAHIDYDYRGKLWTVVGDPRYSLVKSYGLVNARISFAPDDKPFQFGVYGRNLGNTFFATGFSNNYAGSGVLLHFTTPDAYRTVGVFGKYAL